MRALCDSQTRGVCIDDGLAGRAVLASSQNHMGWARDWLLTKGRHPHLQPRTGGAGGSGSMGETRHPYGGQTLPWSEPYYTQYVCLLPRREARCGQAKAGQGRLRQGTGTRSTACWGVGLVLGPVAKAFGRGTAKAMCRRSIQGRRAGTYMGMDMDLRGGMMAL